MNLNDFLSPVELEKPASNQQPDEFSISRTITIHTPDHPVTEINDFDLAIIGIPEDRNSFNQGAADAPNKIREKLYHLRGFKTHLKIIDLGNFKQGAAVTDTYVGACEVFKILIEKEIPVLILGGTQDLTLSSCMAAKPANAFYKLMCIDRKIDFSENIESSTSDNFLNKIITNDKDIGPLEFMCAGYQSYFVNDDLLDTFRHKNFKLSRLGLVRSGLQLIEPELRDSNVVSVDISSVKQSDAPGFVNPSPNGFYGEEICQIARYAGLGEKVSSFGVYEVNPGFDSNNQTSHLAAQICWYFMEGLSQRANENPETNKKSFKKFIVAISKLEQQIVFYKSIKTNRWWMSVPCEAKKYNKKSMIISCSHIDYEIASNDEIPDRWLEAFHRYN